MKSITLPPAHYTFKWPTEDVVRTLTELTKLGTEFAALPEGHAKEALLLEILQCFKGYLLKYEICQHDSARTFAAAKKGPLERGQ